MTRVRRRAGAESDVHFPERRQVQVDRTEELLDPARRRCEAADLPVCAEVLHAAADAIGEVVARLRARRELDAVHDAGPLKCSLDRGVETEIPATERFVDDGTQLPRPRVG